MSSTPADIVEWFKSEYPTHRGTFLFYYRGDWWPFCIKFIGKLNELIDGMRAAGGDIATVGICAQPADKVKNYIMLYTKWFAWIQNFIHFEVAFLNDMMM